MHTKQITGGYNCSIHKSYPISKWISIGNQELPMVTHVFSGNSLALIWCQMHKLEKKHQKWVKTLINIWFKRVLHHSKSLYIFNVCVQLGSFYPNYLKIIVSFWSVEFSGRTVQFNWNWFRNIELSIGITFCDCVRNRSNYVIIKYKFQKCTMANRKGASAKPIFFLHSFDCSHSFITLSPIQIDTKKFVFHFQNIDLIMQRTCGGGKWRCCSLFSSLVLFVSN